MKLSIQNLFLFFLLCVQPTRSTRTIRDTGTGGLKGVHEMKWGGDLLSISGSGIFQDKCAEVSFFSYLIAQTRFLIPCLEIHDLHILIPAGFPRPGWVKLHGEKSPCLKPVGGHPEGVFPLVFRQSERYYGELSARPESGGFTGFSGSGF